MRKETTHLLNKKPVFTGVYDPNPPFPLCNKNMHNFRASFPPWISEWDREDYCKRCLVIWDKSHGGGED